MLTKAEKKEIKKEAEVLIKTINNQLDMLKEIMVRVDTENTHNDLDWDDLSSLDHTKRSLNVVLCIDDSELQ